MAPYVGAEFPWIMSGCTYTLTPEHPEVLVVEDLTKDARYSQDAFLQCVQRWVRTRPSSPPDVLHILHGAEQRVRSSQEALEAEHAGAQETTNGTLPRPSANSD